MSNTMKIILMTLLAGLLLAQNAFALQEVAGPLVISVPVGGSNSVQWGLMNDGTQAINVSLNATGDAAKYLSFPATVNLVPGKTVYTNITANIPANYNLAQNISGTLSATQSGQPGQVQINVAMLKSVTITVTGESAAQLQTSGSNPVSQLANSAVQSSSYTGLASLLAENYVAFAAVVSFVVVILFAFALFKFKNSQNPSKP